MDDDIEGGGMGEGGVFDVRIWELSLTSIVMN